MPRAARRATRRGRDGCVVSPPLTVAPVDEALVGKLFRSRALAKRELAMCAALAAVDERGEYGVYARQADDPRGGGGVRRVSAAQARGADACAALDDDDDDDDDEGSAADADGALHELVFERAPQTMRAAIEQLRRAASSADPLARMLRHAVAALPLVHGLRAFHDEWFVLNDVKPSNVVLFGSLEAPVAYKFIDFARAAEHFGVDRDVLGVMQGADVRALARALRSLLRSAAAVPRAQRGAAVAALAEVDADEQDADALAEQLEAAVAALRHAQGAAHP
jgi:hypothetical protein